MDQGIFLVMRERRQVGEPVHPELESKALWSRQGLCRCLPTGPTDTGDEQVPMERATLNPIEFRISACVKARRGTVVGTDAAHAGSFRAEKAASNIVSPSSVHTEMSPSA